MEAASNGTRVLFRVISDEPDVTETLMKFTRQMEEDYADSQDIALFIYGLRCFFCLDRAEELWSAPDKVEQIRSKWLIENDTKYSGWLSSVEDDDGELKWAKWTFQAKNTILSEFLANKPSMNPLR